MNKAHVTVLLSVLILSLGLAPAPVSAGSEDDAARIEKKFEIRKMAQEIWESSDKRTKEAAKQSKTIQKNNEKMVKQLDECMKLSNRALDEFEKTPPSLLKDKLLKQSNWALSQEPDGCMGKAFCANPNSEIINEVRNEFIEEELEALRDTLEDQKWKEQESEIRELSGAEAKGERL